ncbi:MAG: DNA-binding transcriptional LysR family regulator [Gammaproteobacteria bacterium]|jgi:DNA-binding transcriptional LysR family regulator
MINHNIDMLGLRSFVLANKLGSFSKAADNLSCSQAALSIRIKKLEEKLNTKLFHRNYHTLELTTKGSSLLGEAVLVLKAHDQMLQKANYIETQESVRLGVPEELTKPLFQDVMSQNSEISGLNIELTMLMCRDLMALVDDNKLDMAVTTVPPEVYGGEKLGTRELIWVSSPDFVFDPNKPIPLALHPERCIYRDLILSVFNTAGIDYRIKFSAQGTMSVQAAVAAGMGLTVITQGVVPPELAQVPAHWGLPNLGLIDIRLFKNKSLSPAQANFSRTLKQAFS